MTDEQIDAAVAKACGWSHTTPDTWVSPDGKLSLSRPPRYSKSLDLMRKAKETVLSHAQILDLTWHLVADMAPTDPIHHTTARQHAVAFLKVLNLWQAPCPSSTT